MKYYAVYTLDDEIVGVFNNYIDLNKFCKKKTIKSLQDAVCRLKSGKIDSVIVDGKRYKIYVMEDK